MDVRLQALQAHLAAARAALDAGEFDRAGDELSQALAIDPECTAALELRERLEEAKSPNARIPPPAPAGEPVRPIVSVEGFARFEERARRRRIERRSEAARDAIARGRLRDAAAAIQEIRELDDEAPEVAALTTAVDRASARDRTGARRFGGPRAAGLAAFATIILGATILEQTHRLMSYPIVPAIVAPLAPRSAATAPESRAPATEPTAAATSGVVVTDSVVIPAAELTPAAPTAAPAPATVRQPEPPPQTRPQTMPPPLTAPRRQAPIAVTTAAQTQKLAPPVAEASNPGTPPIPPSVRIAPPAVVASMEPVPVPTTPPVRLPSPSTMPAATTPVTTTPVTTTPVTTTAAATTSVPPPSPPADVPAPRATVEEEGLIRHALQQYRNAYEDLNAQSARAVWPAVNERALARAFDGLESQQLTFDACDVQVHGESALATCHGSARYVAKIGSREPRTEPRVWTFALRKADAGWKIQNARAER